MPPVYSDGPPQSLYAFHVVVREHEQDRGRFAGAGPDDDERVGAFLAGRHGHRVVAGPGRRPEA